jgi:hypothetical protein
MTLPRPRPPRPLRQGGHQRLLGAPPGRRPRGGGAGNSARRDLRDQGRTDGGSPPPLLRPAPHDHRGRTRSRHPGAERRLRTADPNRSWKCGTSPPTTGCSISRRPNSQGSWSRASPTTAHGASQSPVCRGEASDEQRQSGAEVELVERLAPGKAGGADPGIPSVGASRQVLGREELLGEALVGPRVCTRPLHELREGPRRSGGLEGPEQVGELGKMQQHLAGHRLLEACRSLSSGRAPRCAKTRRLLLGRRSSNPTRGDLTCLLHLLDCHDRVLARSLRADI